MFCDILKCHGTPVNKYWSTPIQCHSVKLSSCFPHYYHPPYLQKAIENKWQTMEEEEKKRLENLNCSGRIWRYQRNDEDIFFCLITALFLLPLLSFEFEIKNICDAICYLGFICASMTTMTLASAVLSWKIEKEEIEEAFLDCLGYCRGISGGKLKKIKALNFSDETLIPINYVED